MELIKNKKFLIPTLVLLVLVIIGAAAYFFFIQTSQEGSIDQNRVANLSFQFDSVTLSPGESTTLDVLLETPISATEADVVIVFDPNAILLQEIQPSANNFFGLPREYEIEENIIVQELGQAVYSINALDVDSPASTKQGRGVIATLRLAAQPTFTGTSPILIYKNENAEITSAVKKANYNGSILEQAGTININIQ